MERVYNDIIKEETYKQTLDCGLEVLFVPKRGFTKQYAVFATKYGSNDLEFVPMGEDKIMKSNQGVAHFLEHKMFEQPDGKNAFDKFSKLGSSANAFTNFNMTAYLFSTTQNFYESLKHLIDYVQTPYFTDENVEKEKGIIEQEIKMYDDNAQWKVYFNLLKALYVNHPVKIDIAGTVESIYKITKEELYKCYNTFYDLSNMTLFVVGDLEFDKIKECINKSVKNPANLQGEIQRFYPNEPNEINQKLITEDLSVSIPLFSIGFKDKDINVKGEDMLKKQITTEILMDMLFKKGSFLYEKLYLEGLINENFGAGFTCEIDYAYSEIGGESKNPHKVKDIIVDYIQNCELDEADFRRCKKRKIGMFLKMFDSVEFIANNFMSYRFKNMDLMDYLKILKDITFDECTERFYSHFDEKYSAMSIINPK